MYIDVFKGTIMKNKLFCLLAFALFALVGCVTTLPKGTPVYVYVAENGIVTFRGETTTPSELPNRMIAIGVRPDTHINIVGQGEVPMNHLRTIVKFCGEAGLPNCTIRLDKPKISILTGADAKKAIKPKQTVTPKLKQ